MHMCNKETNLWKDKRDESTWNMANDKPLENDAVYMGES